MAERPVKLTGYFEDDVRRLLFAEGDQYKIAAGVLLMRLIFDDGSYAEDATFFGRMSGSGEGSGTDVFLFHWGENFVGVGAMRVWYVMHQGVEKMLGLCSDREQRSQNSDYPEWPEMIRRAQGVFNNASLEIQRFD